jgi:RNA polymerase sigma-70 factor (ECF subfamily)
MAWARAWNGAARAIRTGGAGQAARCRQTCCVGPHPAAQGLLRGGDVSQSVRREFAEALVAQLPALRRYAMALSGSSVVADDLVQDCIERALRQSEHLKDAQKLGGWLRSILHNLYIDDIRRRRSRGIEEDIADMTDDFALSTPAADHGQVVDFVRAVGGLSVEHRQVLLLVGVEDMNYREIASELKIPIGTVMSRLARAREKLRSALDETAPQTATVIPLSRSAKKAQQ